MGLKRVASASARRRFAMMWFALWLAFVVFLLWHHVFWRDEVRAFSIALSGNSVVEMLQNLQGEGHPALWYLLLRGAHMLVPVREVLPAMAVLTATAAMGLLVFRSPFRPPVIAFILFGAFGLYEYPVMARNYGISMLILFLLADRYRRWRDHPLALGILLALLCNTNVHSVILASGFLAFWFIDISSGGLKWTRRHSVLLANAIIAGIGALACFLQVFPIAHDAVAPRAPSPSFSDLVAVLSPGSSFATLLPPLLQESSAGSILKNVVITGALFGLLRQPGAFLSTLLVLIAFQLLFRFVYPGSYRHEALFLVYLVSMYWLVLRGHGGQWVLRCRSEKKLTRLFALGSACFVLLLALQIPLSVAVLVAQVKGVPASRSAELAALLKRERLTRAIVIADPDVLLEALPYYAPNPIYLLRERRFGRWVRFTREARLRLDLDELLADARALEAANGRQVVIVLQNRLDPQAGTTEVAHTYVQTFSTSSAQIHRFTAATQKLARFGPVRSDESYDVYLLRANSPCEASRNCLATAAQQLQPAS